MASGGWVCFLTGLLSLASAVDHDHQGEADTYHVSAGHLFLLSCQPAEAHTKIMWSRGNSGNESLPDSVEVRDGLLWFLPVQMTHNGSYVCEKRNGNRSSKKRFKVLVSSGHCPDPNENISFRKEKSERLPCHQTDIFRLNLTRKIQWMKDCQPVQLNEELVSYPDGSFRLAAVSEGDAGKYTCLIDVTVDGRNYTTARSIQLTVTNDDPEYFPVSHVISPQNGTVIVQVGKRAELQCKAYVGSNEDAEMLGFWIIDGTYASDYEVLNETWEFIHDGDKVFVQSKLSIATVRREFLNVPIICCITNAADEIFGKAWLQEDFPELPVLRSQNDKVIVQMDHQGEADTYHVSAGHLFLLSCQPAEAHSKIMWSRGNSGNESLPDSVEVRDGLLWFLPVQMTHNGSYVCEKRNENRSSKRRFKVLVSSGHCPDPNEKIPVTKEKSERLPCHQTDIFRLNLTRKIQWMKDCHPVQLNEELVSYPDGSLRLAAVSEGDAGKYTCLIDVTVDGRNYTTARSIQLTVTNDPEYLPEPHVISPQNDTVIVQVGKRAELQCKAYVGFKEDLEMLVYWVINETYASDYEELNETWEFIHDGDQVYVQSNLSIATVQREFLNVPIICCITNAADEIFGKAWLQEADHSELYAFVALCLTVLITLLLLTAFFLLCKVNLILAYRKLNTYFSKPRVLDGKLYDAYVSVSQDDMLSLNSVSCFALRILPEELEQKHGYSLYIRGRDDCPGEGVHDVISTAVHQCRRLMIILSSHVKSKEAVPLCEHPNQFLYEQKVCLHDALMQNDPKIVLVEVDGPVDYSQLPESLRYIKRKQGALQWKNSYSENKLTQMYLKRNFWEDLRCHMPAVPASRLRSIALSGEHP